MSIFRDILNTAQARRMLMKHERMIKDHHETLDYLHTKILDIENITKNNHTDDLASMKRSLLDLGKSYEILKAAKEGGSLESRFQEIEKRIADSQSEMIKEARSWKEIAYAVADKDDIRKEVFRRDAESIAPPGPPRPPKPPGREVG